MWYCDHCQRETTPQGKNLLFCSLCGSPRAYYLPSRQEIAQRLEEIQASWQPWQHIQRQGGLRDPVEITRVTMMRGQR